MQRALLTAYAGVEGENVLNHGEGGEVGALAEVQANTKRHALSTPKERRNLRGNGPLYHLVCKHRILCLLKRALVLLPVNPRGQRFALLIQELLRDARALGGVDFKALPSGAP